MKLRPVALKLFAVSLLLSLSACVGAYTTNLGLNTVSVTISPKPESIPAATTLQFTTVSVAAPNTPVWNFPFSQYLIGSSGTITSTGLYTAPSTYPTYSAQGIAHGAIPGQVRLQATVTSPPSNAALTAADQVTFVITGPGIVQISPTFATVARSGSLQFTAYALGTPNSGVNWLVNGVPGGSTATGTITAYGVYVAPSFIPITGPTVTVTAVSVADSGKTASANVTIS